MKPMFTDEENATIEEMRIKLATQFGVSIIDDGVILRFNGDKKKNREVIMKFDEIDTGEKTEYCFFCGERHYKNDLYETDMEIKMCVGKDKRKVQLCYDCYCPK